jgi:hypothetical protein
LFTAMPRLAISAFITWVTRGTQPPQVAPALVQAFSRPMVVTPSPTAAQICALADVVAGADLGAVGQGIHAQPGLALPSLDGRIRNSGSSGRGDVVEGHLQQGAVLVGIAHQHGAQQVLAVLADHDLLVDLLALVGVAEAAALGGLAVGVADAGHVHAHQLELGAHVGAGKAGIGLAGDVAGHHAGHVVAGGDQAEELLLPGGAFADGVDVRVAGAQVVVHRDAAALADCQPFWRASSSRGRMPAENTIMSNQVGRR